MVIINLNLLPLAERKETRKKINQIELANNGIAVTVVFLAVALVFFAGQKYLSSKVAEFEERTNDKDALVMLLNNKMSQLAVVQRDYVKWSNITADFLARIPTGNKLFSLNLDKTNQKLSLSGYAAKRADFLNLQSALGNCPLISDINSPISNLLRQTEINYTLDAKLNVTAVKTQ